MTDSYLDKSGYPIKNPNMDLNLPNPNPSPEPEIKGVDVNVSSSQAPAPDTQNVNVAPNTQEKEPNPFSLLEQRKRDEDLATVAALKDTQNLVKYIHTKSAGEPIDKDIQDLVTVATENIIENRLNRGGRLFGDLMDKEGFKNDYSFLKMEADNTFVSTVANSINDSKRNIANTLTSHGHGIKNDADIIKALSEEFDKNKQFFIGDAAMNIPNMKLFGDARWLEGTVWDEVFDADTRALYANIIAAVNEHISNSENLSDEDGKKIFMNYAKAVLTLDDNAYLTAIDEIESKTGTNMSSIISGPLDKPIVDFFYDRWRLSVGDTFGEEYWDIGWEEADHLDELRRMYTKDDAKYSDIDWDSPHGAEMYKDLLDLADGDETKALRYKEYLMDDELNDDSTSRAVWHGTRDFLRDWTSIRGIGTLLALGGSETILKASLRVTAPLWSWAVAEPTLAGETAAAVATAGIFVGMGVHGTYSALTGMNDNRVGWDNGETGNSEYYYNLTQNSLGLFIGGLMSKHGLNKPVRYSRFKGKDGNTYIIPSSETAWNWVNRKFKPNYKLKEPALINENVNNYIHKINAKHYKDFAEFDKAFLEDVNIPKKLKAEGMTRKIFDNAEIMSYQGYGWTDAVKQIEQKTGKKLDNVRYSVVKPEPASNVHKNKVTSLKGEIEKLEKDLLDYEKIESKGSGVGGIKELGDSFKNKINLKKVKEDLIQRKEELSKSVENRKGEIEANKATRKMNKNAGDLIIWSDHMTNIRDWAYIRIGKKDGRIHIGETPSGVTLETGAVSGVGTINYFSVKGDKIPGILKETPLSSSSRPRYTGKKLDKSASNAFNSLLNWSEISPKFGDVAGVKGEYVYTGSLFGWQNVMEAGIKNYTKNTSMQNAALWIEKANKLDGALFDGGKAKDYFSAFKNFTRKLTQTELPTHPNKYVGKFKQPETAGKIYTSEPNQDLFKLSEKIKMEARESGIILEDNYITIDGTELWQPKVQSELAKAFKNGEHKSDYVPMIESYKALNKQLPKIYEALIKEGFKVEIWKGKGEPYENSAAAAKDMANGHLYIRQSTTGFGPVEDMNITINEFIKAQNLPEKFVVGDKWSIKGNEPVLNAKGEFHPYIVELFPMLGRSGIKTAKGENLTYNDVFRAVHDYFHHGKSGNSFGPYGELQGFIDGLSLLPEAAHPAFFSETYMQNAFFNTFGKYADQKMVWNPKGLEKVKALIRKPKDGNLVVDNKSPMRTKETFGIFMKESDKTNYKSNGGRWGVIANEITDAKGIKFVLDKLGNKDIEFNGYSLKEYLNKVKDLPPEEIIKINKKFLDDFIINAEKEGRVIHRANTKGVYEGGSETGSFLTGDITTTELQTISLFFGQKSYINNHGEAFSHTTQFNNLNYKVAPHKPASKNYTEITTQDGFTMYITGKPGKNSNNVSSVGESINRFSESDPTNTNFFSSAKDIASWRELFGPRGTLPIDPIPFEANIGVKNRTALEKIIREDGHLVMDWANINDPINGELMLKMYQNNRKMDFRYYDEATGKMVHTEVKYVFDDTYWPRKEGDFFYEAFEQQITWKPKTPTNVDEIAITDGFNKKIITVKELPIVEGDPVKANKGLSENHLGNINLSKLPKAEGKILKTLLNEIGDQGVTDYVRRNIGHEQTIAEALTPKNLESLLNRILIDGYNNGAFLKDGTPNTSMRTNANDVVGGQFLLVEMIRKYAANPTDALGNLIKKAAASNYTIRANTGRSLKSTQIEINGAKINIDNLTMLGRNELSTVYSIFSESDPATIMQKIVELRRNNLLASASSITRSLVGNTFNLAVQMPNKLLSGALNEALTAFDYGIRGGKWDPLKNRQATDMLHFTEGFLKTKGVPNLMWDILTGKEAAIAESAIARNEGWYSKPRIGGTLGKVVTGPQRIQVLLDAIVRKPSEVGFIHEFAHRIAKSEKLSGSEYKSRVEALINKPTPAMVKMAKTSSEYITFQAQLGQWGKMFNRIRTGKGTEALQLVFPFFNTSVNLMKVGYNMTPLGLATPKYFGAMKDGFTKGEWGKFSDQTARVAVGTSIMWWMNQAMGGGQYNYEGDWKDEDKVVRESKASLGLQPNSVWWEDNNGQIKSLSTVGFEPLASIMNISAAWKENKDEDFHTRTEKVILAWGNQFKQNPFMQGTSDFIDLTMGRKDPVTYITRMLLSSVIPNIIMQGGKIKDDIRYENPYKEKWRLDELDNWQNSLLSEFRYIENDSSVPKVNLFGEPVRVPDPKGALLALRALEGKESKSHNSIAKEIIRLAPKIGDMDFEIKNFKDYLQLTPKQAFLLEVSAGRAFYKELEHKMTGGYAKENGVTKVDENNYFIRTVSDNLTKEWADLPDAAKIKMIKTLRSAIRKAQLFGMAPELFKKGEYGDWELMDPKDFVVYKEGDKSKGFEEIDVIREELTKRYRETEKGTLEVAKAEKYANEIIVLMRRGMDKGEAIDNILTRIKE